jgi:hypothetical protein
LLRASMLFLSPRYFRSTNSPVVVSVEASTGRQQWRGAISDNPIASTAHVDDPTFFRKEGALLKRQGGGERAGTRLAMDVQVQWETPGKSPALLRGRRRL